MRKSLWKVGLLGAGFIIDAHAKALNSLSNVKVIAVCDQSLATAEKASLNFSIEHVYTSLEEMLETDIDVVHVLLPPDFHIDTAKQIVESGRHVFLEKPMGLDAKQCQALVDLAREKEVKLAVNHNFLFLPCYEKLRQQVTDGTLGNLDQLTINWLYPLSLIQFGPFNSWMLRAPQNLLFELGPHLIGFVNDLVGPMDNLQVDVFRPVDLPGGNRVYRRWHIHGRVGNIGVDLNIAVTPGYTDRSISVRGHAATAKCDYDRGLYYRDEPAGYGLLFDSFFTTLSLARQLSFNALGNLIKAVSNTLKRTPAANPFGESIERSIKAFYEGLDGDMDSRLDGQFGVQVIATCEQIILGATFETVKDHKKKWVVLPPLKVPSVLVIGGTGFIGKSLVKALTGCGHGVRVVTRSLSSGQLALAGLPVELVQGNLDDETFLDEAMDGIDIVYHLAKTEGSKWEDYYTQDVLVTKKIAERACANNIKRFIYTGTIDSYYSANKNEVITADTPLDLSIKRRNHYARAKAACESLLMEMYKINGLPLVIMRPGIVIGKGCPPAHWGVGMFQSETRVQFWGDGKNKLPLVLVDDVASALLAGLDRPDIEGKIFLLTDEPVLSAREYVDIVSEVSGIKFRADTTSIWKLYLKDALKEIAKHLIRHPNRKYPSYRDWDSRSHRARYDNSKTKDLLGWEPIETKRGLIEQGIVPAVQDFLN